MNQAPYWNSQDYREILRSEFESRIRRNSRYSMGAFARHLGISLSALSMVFSGKRGLSPSVAMGITEKLGFDSEKANFFIALVESSAPKNKVRQKSARDRVSQAREKFAFQGLSDDQLQMIEQWQHSAILMLATCEDYQPDEEWIAKRLGLTPAVAKQAIQRLIALRLLTPKKDGLLPTHKYFEGASQAPSESVRKYHSGLLQRAQDALEKSAREEREFVSCIAAIDESRIAEFKESLYEFARSFSLNASKSCSRAEVYCLGVQLFKLTQTDKTESFT